MQNNNDGIRKKLKTLIKEIEEIPERKIDRYLIIDEIKNIIKDSKESISSREIIAARLGFLASLPQDKHMIGIENIKDHALSLGFTGTEFERFFPWVLSTVLKIEDDLLEALKKEKSNESH